MDKIERHKLFINAIREETADILVSQRLDEKRAFAVNRLHHRLAKKLDMGNDAYLEAKTLRAFEETNELASKVVVRVRDSIARVARTVIQNSLEAFTCRLASEAGYDCGGDFTLSLPLLMDMWRYGPGSSRGTTATHFLDKSLVRNPSVTKRASRYFDLCRRMNPHLRSFDGPKGCGFHYVTGSTLSTVPKNEDTRRTICTEPLGNMALQLAAGMYIEGALREIGLDIQTQPAANAWLAEMGSLGGGIATIDLKSASDLITPALIKELWPANWYELLMIFRSPTTKLPDGREIQLHMMSTMGNGFTFPMMTLTLAALMYAVKHHRPDGGFPYLQIDRDSFCTDMGVFGDDIIVPTELYGEMCEVLREAGLIVNLDKSFASGGFRESCGGDYFKGYDVTPFYVKSLATDPEVYIAINQLLEWCAEHDVFLKRTYQVLLSLLERPSPLFVPVYEDAFAGIRASVCPKRYRKYTVTPTIRKRKLDHVHPDVAMLCLIGGFASTYRRTDGVEFIQYTVRQDDAVVYKLENARLPKGYLDGSDWSVRPAERDKRINTWICIFSDRSMNDR